MAAKSEYKPKATGPKGGKAKLGDARKRKATEDEPVAKPKKIKAVKPAEKENAGKTSIQEKPPKEKRQAKKKAIDEAANTDQDETTAKAVSGAQDSDPEAEGDDEAGNAEADALAAAIDSGDEAEEVDKAIAQFEEGQDVGAIPKLSKKERKALEAARNEKPGVVYVGRIPHGFYEHEMRQYFTQFGPITRLRLSRNKRTGASKHFAFIEFAQETTAEIVAKTMDNYLLFGHILKCKVVPSERVHKDLWVGANRRFKEVPWNKMAGNELSKPATQSAWERRVTREQRRRTLKAEKLKELGYDFSAPVIKAIPAPVAQAKPAEIEGDAEKSEEVEEAPKALPEPPVEPEPVQAPEPAVEAEKPSAKVPKAKKAVKGRKTKSKA